ncbi:tetratricopeptide repeat protein [Desulfosporosinus sp.]|uniref:tetratricopeptide repeat protein n=1 Tax=Desulfosporosinus sp. TaxID=157907 RepID=UPI00230FF0EC|nr:tetratricopeptide repeat protein [Desulfosporosinus sp.]MCO5386799.1 tetratricopeptide repeat protein [Desulfosporosinus sp.]MDA8220348.1 tetratricopeptide repeat protein [Desulfitobacterium hafniense]
MRKRLSSKIIISLGVVLVIAITVFYTLQSNSTFSFTSDFDQTLSPTELEEIPAAPEKSLDSSSEPQDKELSPTSVLLSVHISDSQALVLYEQGLKLYYQRQFPDALDLFNQALKIDDHCYEALNAKGAALAFQGHHNQGLALIKQALDLNPSFVYAHFNQGLAYELAGRWDESIASYQKALQLDDRDTWSYYGIASIYGRQGNVDKVLEYLKLAIALDTDVKEVARNEHDFLPVRSDPRFQTLVKP